MLIRKIVIENVRSFLDRQEMTFDGNISIIVGPNGGGKTNLLDTVVTMIRRHLIAAPYLIKPNPPHMNKWQLRQNEMLNGLNFEKHTQAKGKDQTVEITIEVSESDITNMRRIKEEAKETEKSCTKEFLNSPWSYTENWDVDAISAKEQITYTFKGGVITQQIGRKAGDFLQYLNLFEFDQSCRGESNAEPLQLPMIYLPVNRASSGFNSKISLASFNDVDQKRQLDGTSSRSGGSNIVGLAVGRLAMRYRRLESKNNVSVKTAFYDDEQLRALTDVLAELGYKWELETVDEITNEYDVIITKQDTKFISADASSGEREILTYLFAIYVLNVRDAVIVVDEPELHLHPSWQKTLFSLFERLSNETGNQFILATHSPTFISPKSIQCVSRVYMEDQKSKIVRLNSTELPDQKHLFNMVNSQNNEKLLFCDHVVLVEGLSDRIFFEKIMDKFRGSDHKQTVEIISVGGKGLFESYRKLLKALSIQSTIIADLDYIEQVGSDEIKSLFETNKSEIKTDIIDNAGSLDAEKLFNDIEKAMSSSDWGDASDTWKYIKSRRRTLKKDISDKEKEKINNFIDSKRICGLNILRKGALEDYLPSGFRNKDIGKLIKLLECDNFWDKLPLPQRDEVEYIVQSILNIENFI